MDTQAVTLLCLLVGVLFPVGVVTAFLFGWVVYVLWIWQPPTAEELGLTMADDSVYEFSRSSVTIGDRTYPVSSWEITFDEMR